MIIWDELQHGKNVFENGLNSKKYQMSELGTVVSYMSYVHYSPAEMRDKLNELCYDDIKFLDEKDKKNIFNKLIAQYKDSYIIHDVDVTIYKSEIEKIQSCDDIVKEKMLFIMLVYKKWIDRCNEIKYINSTKEQRYFTWFDIKDADLINEAKLKSVNTKKKKSVLHELCDDGYFESSIRKISRAEQRKEKVQVKHMRSLPWMCFDGDVAFTITDYRNVIFRYLDYINGGFKMCERCGKIIEKSPKKHKKVCDECAKIINVEKQKLRDKKQNLDL